MPTIYVMGDRKDGLRALATFVIIGTCVGLIPLLGAWGFRVTDQHAFIFGAIFGTVFTGMARYVWRTFDPERELSEYARFSVMALLLLLGVGAMALILRFLGLFGSL